jgi:hypothetical protein
VIGERSEDPIGFAVSGEVVARPSSLQPGRTRGSPPLPLGTHNLTHRGSPEQLKGSVRFGFGWTILKKEEDRKEKKI